MPILDPAAYLNETLTLDPVSEDALNSPLTLTSDPYGLMEHHYPQPAIDPQWASSVSTEGAVLASNRYQNREISITVDVSTLTGLRALQAKLAKLAREGGTLQRTMSDGTTITFDVLVSDGYDPGFDQTWHLATITTVTFSLTCKPLGRGPEVSLSAHSETTLPALVFTETGIKGDVSGLGRLVITNNSTNQQAMAVWGIQSRYYDGASTAALFYQAEACAIVGPAAVAVGATGASGSGSNVVRHGDVGQSPGWNKLVYIGASSTAQTHVGSFRVFARCYIPATNTGTVSVRAVWQPYIGASTVTNTEVPLTYDGSPAEGWWLLADLGNVTIAKASTGTQGWLGWIEGGSTVATDDLDIDYLFLVPTAEGSGQVIGTANEFRPIIASGTITARHDSALLSVAGGYYRPAPKFEGDYLRIPPAGAEARTLRVICKIAQGQDSAGINSPVVIGPPVTGDSTIDDISATLNYTPRYLAVPSS